MLSEVAAERVRQDAKWGGPAHDDQHSMKDFCRFIEDRLYGGCPSREALIEVAALAVASIESIDRRTADQQPAHQPAGVESETPQWSKHAEDCIHHFGQRDGMDRWWMHDCTCGATDQQDDDSALDDGEEWAMNVAGVWVKLDEWQPGAVKRRAAHQQADAP